MQIKAKEVRRTVNLLEDPQPGWMALVDNGANQTPFAVVKRDRITRKSGKETDDMARKGKGSKAPDARLTKMQLSKDKFTTRKAVRKYLEDNNIEGTGEIEDGDDVWIVKSLEDFSDVTLGKARSTATKHEGVTAFIAPVLKASDEEDEDEDEDEAGDEDEDGEADTVSKDGDPDEDEDGEEAEDADEEEEDEPKGKKAASKVKTIDGTKTKVRRAPKPKAAAAVVAEETEVEPVLELSAKYDWWGAYTSGSDDLLGVLRDGMNYDNVPPGMEEVMGAAYTTIGNVLGEDNLTGTEKQAKLAQMGQELGAIAFGLYSLFEQATTDATKSLKPSVRKSAKKFADSFAESIARIADGDFSQIVDNVDNDAGEAPAKKAVSADGMPTWAKKLIGQVGGLADKVNGVTETLARGTVQRSMSDSLEEIVGDGEDEADEDEAAAAARVEEVRRSMGLRGPAITPAASAQ
jgi:hypothetical protein